MATSYFSVSLSTVSRIGSRLSEISSTVEFDAAFTEAHGAEPYGDVIGAVCDYKGDWDNAVARIGEKISGWGERASAASKLMADHDQSLADSLRPQSQ